MDRGKSLWWFVAGAGLLTVVLLGVGYKMGTDNTGVAVAQTGAGPTGNSCYTQQYNANGTKNGTPVWFPCAPTASLWTLNQAQQAKPITPANDAKFAPTKALFVGASGACSISMQLVNDATAQVWSNVNPGVLPVQVIDVEATSTTCTNIYGLY